MSNGADGVYAKKLNKHQRQLLIEYYNLTGFEPMCQEDFDAGKITFIDLWDRNVDFIANIYGALQNMKIPD